MMAMQPTVFYVFPSCLMFSSNTGMRQELRSARRLDYNSPPRKRNVSSFYSSSQENLQPNFDHLDYSPEIPPQDGPWRPGQRLPLSVHPNLMNNSQMETRDRTQHSIQHIQSMIQQMQSSIEGSLACY